MSYRITEGTTINLFKSEGAAPQMKWDIIVKGVLNQDTGTTKIRIQHYLQAHIMATDKVLFELAFTAKSAAAPTVDTAI